MYSTVFASGAKQSKVVSDIRRVPAVFDELYVLHARREAELLISIQRLFRLSLFLTKEQATSCEVLPALLTRATSKTG
jgi:hypothetical protein